MSLLLLQWPLLFVYLWYSSPCTLTLRPLTSMTLCHSSPVLPLVGVLILVSVLISLLSSTICFSRFFVIVFSLSLTFILFPLREYALVTDAPMSFPSLFISSVVEVHRSSAKSHGLFFSVFINRILLDLGLEDFPTSDLSISQLLYVPPSFGKEQLS